MKTAQNRTGHFLRLALMAGSILLALPSQAQKVKNKNNGGGDNEGGKQKVFITAGPEFNLILPISLGNDGRGFLPDSAGASTFTDTMAQFTPKVSFRLGMNVRFDFSKRFSLQTGLYYIQRIYSVDVGLADVNRSDFASVYASGSLKYTGFELPVMGLFYVQLGKHWFMNNLVGLSADFFPSSVVDTAGGFKIFGGRNGWIIPSMKAAIGFEARTNKSGYFYLGAQFHRPLVPIFIGQVQRQKSNGESLWGYNYIDTDVSGTYFAIDFKYFFPPSKKNRFTDP